jgi:4-diphosphocytidyl-2C-methyl-D-erythritol kinase
MTNLTDEEQAQQTQLLSRRNTIALQQALQRLQDKVDVQEKTIHGLQATIQTLSARLDSIELMTRVQKAMLSGTGPTVRD